MLGIKEQIKLTTVILKFISEMIDQNIQKQSEKSKMIELCNKHKEEIKNWFCDPSYQQKLETVNHTLYYEQDLEKKSAIDKRRKISINFIMTSVVISIIMAMLISPLDMIILIILPIILVIKNSKTSIKTGEALYYIKEKDHHFSEEQFIGNIIQKVSAVRYATNMSDIQF
ncbi:MAG: hypothetical protein PUB18_00045 [bacterium]|nr:hypothetical protein [bacterium]